MLLIFSAIVALGQENYKGCPMGGDKPSLASKDSLKNRFVIPASFSSIDFESMAKMKVGSTSHKQTEAVKLKGYVLEVKFGGSETCNCHTTDKTIFDTHIVLVKDETVTDAKDGIVVEITPRVRELMAKKALDWTTEAVSKEFLHKVVTVEGYLFDDSEHTAMSAADGAHPANTHRATCWEIHPVTGITL